MLDTFKARLKAKYPGVNLSSKRIDAIAARLHKKHPDLTEEADHDARLDELNELTPFDEIAKDDDKIRNLEARAKPNPPAQPKPPVDKTDPPADDPEVPAWAKALIDQNKLLADKLNGFEREKTQGTIKQQLQQKIKDVPEAFWAKRALPEKADDIDAFVTDVTADYSGFTKELTDKGFAFATPPVNGAPPPAAGNKKVDPAIAQFVKTTHKPEATKT